MLGSPELPCRKASTSLLRWRVNHSSQARQEIAPGSFLGRRAEELAAGIFCTASCLLCASQLFYALAAPLTPIRPHPTFSAMSSRRTFRRSAILALLLALLAGWSGQALSLVMSGVCVAPRTCPSAPAPDQDSQIGATDDDSMPPCEGVALRCVNSVGCVIFVGLPQAELGALPVPPPGDRHAAVIHELPGLALQPELSPPILGA